MDPINQLSCFTSRGGHSQPQKHFVISQKRDDGTCPNMGHFNKSLDLSVRYTAICIKVSFIEFN
jgi:hypothetical protein